MLVIYLALGVFGLSVGNTFGAKLANEIAQKIERPVGSPRYSDVSMRIFRQHSDSQGLKAAKDFHITRVDWSYIEDAGYIDKVHSLGWSFQGTMSAITYNENHALKDRNGQPIHDYYGVKRGSYWADVSNESYQQWYISKLEDWLDLGVDSIQRDAPTSANRTSIEDSAKFFKLVSAAIEQKLGKDIPMSCNLTWNESVFGGKGEPVTMLFSYGMSELKQDKVNPEFFWESSKDARNRGKALVYTANKDYGVAEYQRAIAGCYATGMHFMVPWDQYSGVGNPRIFSKPEDLANIYGFVRANRRFLDGYEDVAAVGFQLDDQRWRDDVILSIEGSESVSAFVRAKPENTAAPVVIHLIEWEKGGSFTLKLNAGALYENGNISAELRTPAVHYSDSKHAEAEASKKYDLLSKNKILDIVEKDGMATLRIPALQPWGIVVVENITDESENSDGGPN